MDKISYRVEATTISSDWTTQVFRLDSFTDEALMVDWVTSNNSDRADRTSMVTFFRQIPRGPALFELRTTGGGFTGDADCIWTNTIEDAVLWARVPGTLLSNFAGIRRQWAYGVDTWPDPVESTWRYFAAAVRLTTPGPGTFWLNVKSLADPPRPPSTWKLSPLGYWAPSGD